MQAPSLRQSPCRLRHSSRCPCLPPRCRCLRLRRWSRLRLLPPPVAVVASQPPPAAEPLPVPAAEVSLPRAEAAAFVFAPLPNISAGDYCACTADGVSGGSNTTGAHAEGDVHWSGAGV